MKKFLIIAVAAVCVVSCFKGSQFKATYNPVDNFEYGTLFGESKKDSAIVPVGGLAPTGFLVFVNNVEQEGDSYSRGFFVSMKHNKFASVPETSSEDEATAVEEIDLLSQSVYSEVKQNSVGLPNTFAIYRDGAEDYAQDIVFRYSLNYPLATCTMRGMNIANTSWVVDQVLNQGAFKPKSEAEGAEYPGDYFILSIKGYNNDALTGEINYALVDYRKRARPTRRRTA